MDGDESHGVRRGKVSVPVGMTEEEVLSIVRELLGDDMSDADLMSAYTSGLFQELCPDIAQYAKQKKLHNKRSTGSRESKNGDNNDVNLAAINPERGVSCESDLGIGFTCTKTKSRRDFKPTTSKIELTSDSEVDSSKLGPNRELQQESDSDLSNKHNHHKKKKKRKHKRKKDPKRDKSSSSNPEQDLSKLTNTYTYSKFQHKMKHQVDLSGSDNEPKKNSEKFRKNQEVKVMDRYTSSSGSESDKVENEWQKGKEIEKYRYGFKIGTENDKKIKEEKQHSHKQGKMVHQQKEPKPCTKYNSAVSNIKIRQWKPVFDKEHVHFQKKFRLKPLSIVCLDLLELPILFHNPLKRSKNPNSIALTSNLPMTTSREDMIRRLERDKLTWFKGKLTKQALKVMKSNKRNKHYSEDERKKKQKRVRILELNSDSSSSISSDIVPRKRQKIDDNDRKVSKADRDAETRIRKLEEIKRKAEKLSVNGTRVLPWENKDEYFQKRKKKSEANKEKGKPLNEKRIKFKKMREVPSEKQRNAPSVSFQRILAQIDAANREEANKPTVALKIPKISQRERPPTEFKIEGKLSVGDVAKEVSRLLKSDVKVEVPVMPDSIDDLGEYTVKKIAWWILKNEKDPPPQGLFHPELHDRDDELESNHSDDFEWPSDVSSIHGCVSDPEGLAMDTPPDPTKVNDADWADEYCGENSLYARMRRDHTSTDRLESDDQFKKFLRIKPGTNYCKINFEAKCFLCNELIQGQRKLGAHIRSESHKNNFRNYSLNLANYEEDLQNPVPKKEFIAKLVEYSVKETRGPGANSSENLSDGKKHKVKKIDRIRSDSPGPIIAGDAAANIEVHEMPIPDNTSFASIQDYDVSSDESLMQVKVAIRTSGEWNNDLEHRWRTWRDEEAKIVEAYNEEREYFINKPERHPRYQEEWLKFWEKRSMELESDGVDVEKYNFQKDWYPFWLKRMQEILKEQIEEKVFELKKSLRIDKHTLRRIYGISSEETKRKEKKKKVDAMGFQNSSSPKSSAKGSSYNMFQQNSVISTERVSNQTQNDNIKLIPRSESAINMGRKKYEFDNVSASNLEDDPGAVKGKYDEGHQSNHLQCKINCQTAVSNVSSVSAEPLSPLEKKLLPDESRVINNLDFSKFKTRHVASNENRFENKSSQVSSVKRNSSTNNSTRKTAGCQDNLNEIKTAKRGHNTQDIQSGLQEQRVSLAVEALYTSNTKMSPSARPKVKPVDKTANLEEGEVASDGSSTSEFNADNGTKDVSTFFNKNIPGLLKKDHHHHKFLDSLNRNSLGYHLLERERRKSPDQQTDAGKDQKCQTKHEVEQKSFCLKNKLPKQEGEHIHTTNDKSEKFRNNSFVTDSDEKREHYLGGDNSSNNMGLKSRRCQAYKTSTTDARFPQEESVNSKGFSAEIPGPSHPIPEAGNPIPVIQNKEKFVHQFQQLKHEGIRKNQSNFESWKQSNYHHQRIDYSDYYRN